MVRLGILVALISGHAFALKCVTCSSNPTLVLPDQSENVPTNVIFRVRFASPPPSAFVLQRTSDEQPVSLRFNSGPGFKLWSIAPEAPLEPQTQYTMSTPLEVITFTTGDGADLVAPETPAINAVMHQSTPGLCSTERWTIELEGGSDDATPRDELMVFVQTSGSDELADASYVATLGTPVIDARCGFEPPSGATFPVAVQVMDRAGNVSKISNTKRAPSCSISPGGAMGIVALALLRSRRRR